MSQISIFKNKTDTKAVKNTTVDEFLEDIKNGKCRPLIDPLRSEIDPDKKKGLKGRLPAVTVSGVFLDRKEDGLLSHSGFISIDFDDVSSEKVEPLKKDPYTYALALSASGNGYFAVVKVNALKHKQSFNWLQEYYFKKYNLVLDPSPKNVASLRFYSYDPNLYLNKESKVAKVKADHKPKKPLKLALTEDKFSEYVKEVAERGLNITESYFDFRDVAFGIASEYKEAGREYFHVLASQSGKYEQKAADKQYDEALKERKSGITIGTVYHWMKLAGVELSSSVNSTAISFTKAALKRGETKDSVKKTLKEIHGLNEAQAELAINAEDELTFDDDNYPQFIKNFRIYLQNRWKPKFNEVKSVYEINGEEVTTSNYNSIAMNTKLEVGSKNATDTLINQFLFNSDVPKYNPFKDWIKAHQNIKRGGELKKILSALVLKDNSTSARYFAHSFVTRWLVGLHATIDGHVVRSVLTLIGPGNCGKSTWFRKLLPEDLREYFGESRFDKGKDDEILMCRKLILLDDEASSKNAKDEAKFKELASKDVFSLRVPYGKSSENFKRLALLCMTSNPTTVINDPTGNTRILPIHIDDIDYNLMKSIDRDALFMELHDLYVEGMDHELQPDEFAYLAQINKDFEHTIVEYDLVDMYCEPSETGGMNATQVLNGLCDVFKGRNLNPRRISEALKRNFGDPKKVMTQGGSRSGYKVKFNSVYYENSYSSRIM